MPFSALDIAVLGVTVISAVLAAVRGCAREVLGISSWIIAALAAWFLFPSLLPFTHQYIHHETIALVATIAAIFIVVLVIMSLVTVQISDLILDSRIGALDRTLGLVFGVVRGFLICVLGWLLLSMFIQGKPEPPEWAANAKTRPILQSSADSVYSFIKPMLDKALAALHEKQGKSGTGEPPPESPQPPTGGTAPAPAATGQGTAQ